MKILVPVKRIMDYRVMVKIKPDHSGVDTSGAAMVMNPLCEVAVEEAVRQKESGVATEIVVVSIGEKACQEQLRMALAMGADRGIHIVHEACLNALQIAKLLKIIVDEEEPGLVILGNQSVDTDNCQTGQMLGALTHMPQGTFASRIAFEEEHVMVTRETDDGFVRLKLKLPSIITVSHRMNEPRYVTLPNIMKAKRKPITTRQASEMGVSLENNVNVLKVESPQQHRSCIMIESIDALLHELREKAKVI